MMADFCYTNPTIVPGELLSRRGFSMYSGTTDEDFGKNKNAHYGTYYEARSKFWYIESEIINPIKLLIESLMHLFMPINWPLIKSNGD